MLLFASILALVAVTSAKLPMHDGRIVGGVPTTIENFPYQVSIERGWSHSCGGSIFSEKYILTAAHCVLKTKPSSIRVRVGSTKRETSGRLYSVESIAAYPGFTMDNFDSDVAVIKLNGSITFGPGSQPITLVSLDDEPNHGDILTVTGWGKTTPTGSDLPSVLQMVRVPTIDRSFCRFSYGEDAITETMLCAGVSRKDSCQGDSGGPLVNNKHELVGIVSWGKGCAIAGYPGVYANVANNIVRNFIIENTKA